VWAQSGGEVFLNLDLSFDAKTCCELSVWVNDLSKGPIATIPIRAGKRATYSTPIFVPQVSRLRLDPGSTADGSVVVHRIWISHRSHVVARLPADVIRRYSASRAVAKPVPGGTEFRATGPEPTLDSLVFLDPRASHFRLLLLKVLHTPLDYVVLALVLGAAAALPLSLTSRRELWWVVAVGGVVLMVWALPKALSGIPLSDEVDAAVGYASFSGQPKRHDQLLFQLTTLAALALPAVVAFATRGFRSSAPPAPAPLQARARRSDTVLPLGVVLILGLFFMPDLKHVLAASRTMQYTPNWDSNNLLFWDYLVDRGLHPVRDFFYPYGFQYLFTIDAPWGTVIAYVSYMLFWSYVVVGTHLLLSRFFSGTALAKRTGLIFVFVLGAAFAGYLPLQFRYVGVLGVVLFFAAIDHTRGNQIPRRLLFALALLHVALIEPVQVIYAVPALAVLGVLEARRVSRAQLLRRSSVAALLVLAPLAIVAVVLAASDKLNGTLDFYEHVPAETIAWAVPSLIESWISRPNDLSGAVFWAVPLTVAIGACGVLAKRRAASPYEAVLAVGVLGFMLMQKQVVRQGIQSAIWFPAVYGLLIWLVGETSFARARQRTPAAAVFGAVLAILVLGGGVSDGLVRLVRGPARLARSAATLATERDEFAAVDRTRFSPERFRAFTRERSLVAALRGRPELRHGTLWMLGDLSPVIMMLDLRWPYYFATYYDMSPTDWQRQLVRQLEASTPDLVVWDTQETTFDGVPVYVRDPIVFDWAIQNLRPRSTIGSFELLQRRGNARIDLRWWSNGLGTRVDLGHVPRYTKVSGSPCADRSCRTFAVVKFRRGADVPESATVRFTIDGLPFEATFAGAPDTHRYVLDLDRLWFWHNAPPAARSVDLSSVGGATIALQYRRVPASKLF
jgi:hypothetical protein